MQTSWLILLAIVLLSNTVQSTTGFGSAVIALGLGAHLIPVKDLVVALVILGWFQCIWLVYIGHKHIDWRQLTRRIFPLCGAGLAMGVWVFNSMNEDLLKLLLGVFILVTSILEIVRQFKGQTSIKPLKFIYSIVVLGLAGIIHGVFASGGPLVVYYTSRVINDKARFRATLSMLWIVLGSILLCVYMASGRIDKAALSLAGFLTPGLIGGIIIGEFLHARVNETAFRKAVYIVLFFAGLSLLVQPTQKYVTWLYGLI